MKFLCVPCFFVLVTHQVFAQPTLSLNTVINGLTFPIAFVHAGDGSNRIFIVQKGGSILVYDKSYSFLDTFLVLKSNFRSEGERGLLSLAFHPDYANSGFFYIYYTNGAGDLELDRYKVTADPNKADTTTRVVVKTILHNLHTNHNGGELHFGADGFLYLSTGDGGGGGDALNNAQNTGVLLGKILRFNVNTSATAPYYTIPPDNPFGNEVYAYGLRNPFRWSFDRLTQDMWIGDVGQDSWEEINHRPVDSSRGANYGWRCYEANASYNTSSGCCGPLTNYTFPVYTYPTADPSTAVTGGTVYRGSTYISLNGYYVAADFYSGAFYLVKLNTQTGTWVTRTQVLPQKGISDFGQTEDGELYAVSLTLNSVFRISASGPLSYTFTGNGNWSDPANWSNNTVPPLSLPADAVIFIEPAANGECVLDRPQTILPGGKLTVGPNKKFRLSSDLNIK